MELQNFITERELNTFEKIKDVFTSDPFFMEVKGDDNSCILLSTTKSPNTKFIRTSNGCVIDATNKKVVSYFPHIERKEITNDEESDEKKVDFVKVEELIDGSVVRLYHHNDKWIVATLRTIDASKAYWQSNKSFSDLFYECNNNRINFDKLNKNYIYGFIIQHPENKIVTHYNFPDIIHIMTINREDFKEVEYEIELINTELKLLRPKQLIFNDYNQLLKSCKQLYHYIPGYLVTLADGTKTKFIAPHYTFVKSLKGNTPKIDVRYLQMRNDKRQVNDLLLYYPELIEMVNIIESNIINEARSLHRKYVAIKIYKQWHDLTSIEKMIIYKIHEKYLQTKNPVDFQTVYSVISEIPYYKLAMLLKIPLH